MTADIAALESERARLLKILDEVCDSRKDIEKQISDAKRKFASGGPAANIDWLRKAETASLFRASQARKIQARLGEIKLEIKKHNMDRSAAEREAVQKHFMDVCREEMTGAEFERIIQEAMRRQKVKP